MKIRTLIVEDEQDGVVVLEKMCEQFIPDIQIVAFAQNIDEAISVLNQKQIDLVFLDIHLGEDSGFNLFKHFPNPSFEVIFTTAYSDYALDAFATNAIDYILKPVDIDDLLRSVERVKAKIETKKLLNNKKDDFKLKLKTTKGIELIDVSNIVRCEAQGSYSKLIVNNGKEIIVSKNLKNLEQDINKTTFLRIHRSHLVNLNFLKEIFWGEEPKVLLTNDDCIPITKFTKQEFFDIV